MMTDGSDTESESSAALDGWDAAEFVQMSIELAHIDQRPVDAVKLRDALDTLESIDICALESDDRLFQTIQHVSTTLLSFLEWVVATREPTQENIREAQTALLILLNGTSLSLLLKYRILFRDIASRSSHGSTSSIPVCWVDVVLGRLGQVIVIAAGLPYAVQPSDGGLPDSVRAQKEDDLLRAAVQLPDTWPAICQLLCSEYASPAAARLALSLVWGVTVMARELARDDDAFTDMPANEILGVLRTRIKHIGKTRSQDVYVRSNDISEHERVAYAMLIGLYAVVDPVALTSADSPGRPQLYAILLEMIQDTICSDNPTPHPIHPVVQLDLPMVILMKWGRSVPWSWISWNDSRIYNSEVAECLTATWLYHLDVSASDAPEAHSAEWWDDELVEALESDPLSALSMMSRLIFSVVQAARDVKVDVLGIQVLDMVLKACWCIKHILHTVSIADTALSPLSGIMYRLFLLLSDGECELNVKDLILEGISFSLPSLCTAMDAFGNPGSESTPQWEQKIIRIIKMVHAEGSRECTTRTKLRDVRQTLQALTLVWRSGRTPTSTHQMSRHFLSAILDWLEPETLDSSIWTMVGDAAIGALSAWLQYVEELEPDPGLGTAYIWGLFGEADPGNIPVAASLAAYVVATTSRAPLSDTEALEYCEAWDYFRDVTLLILTHEFWGADEPLALLVFSAICRALAALARHAPFSAIQYYLNSSWTGTMITHMDRAFDEQGHAAEYNEVLRKLIEPSLKPLYTQLSDRCATSDPATPADAENEGSMDFTFCWNQSRPCLVPC